MPLSKEEELKLEEHRNTVSLLEAHLKSKGWKFLDAILLEQVRSRRTSSFGMRIRGFEDCFTKTALSGEVAGLLLSRQTPETLIEDAKADIRVLLEKEREDA